MSERPSGSVASGEITRAVARMTPGIAEYPETPLLHQGVRSLSKKARSGGLDGGLVGQKLPVVVDALPDRE